MKLRVEEENVKEEKWFFDVSDRRFGTSSEKSSDLSSVISIASFTEIQGALMQLDALRDAEATVARPGDNEPNLARIDLFEAVLSQEDLRRGDKVLLMIRRIGGR